LILVCYVAYTAKYLTYLLKSTEVIQICEFDNLHMTQCAKIIVGFMVNVGNVFYPTFTNVFLYFLHVFTFLRVFLNFHLNVYYIYGLIEGRGAISKHRNNSKLSTGQRQ